MTGRGRGRLLNMYNNTSTPSSKSSSADINDLFKFEKSPMEVYNVLKSFILAQPFNKTILRTCLDMLVKNMISNSINAVEICKTLYVCSCYHDKLMGFEVWSQFFTILELKFNELHSEIDRVDEVTLRNFTRFFITAIHFMRNPASPPKEDIISAILILINRLNRSNSDDRQTFCQSVAWISSYMKCIIPGTILTQAYTEAVDQVREWILEGVGGNWALACLEAACNGGFLPYHSIKFYSRHLTNSQFVTLSECSQAIVIPARDKSNYNLPKIDCISYLD